MHTHNTAVCEAGDIDALRQFSRDWFADPRSKPVE